ADVVVGVNRYTETEPSPLTAAGRADLPVVVGGIIPAGDADTLRAAGVARVFTPKDFALTGIIDDLVTVIRRANDLP
ncbi:hypothetical protein KBX53_21065, partial [Micromonospora sp. M51]|nr:hypothetical protein [Micromonospora sp. M51]